MPSGTTLYDAIMDGKKLVGARPLLPQYFPAPRKGKKASPGGQEPPGWLLEAGKPGSDAPGSNALPPFLIALHQEKGSASTRKSLEAFEMLSLAVRHHFLVGRGKRAASEGDEKPWGAFTPANTLKASDITSALRRAAHDVRHPAPGRSSPEQVPGLKLVGFKIEGDLDLSKLDLPFSVRLACCWIDGALLLDRTRLSTLDLSGSVITRGASCNFLETDGAVRLRRTVFAGPLDLGGATIKAVFDASDCIVVPKFLPPGSVSFVGDRHALNLSLSMIGKEARLNRARIYGGLNLRGAKVDGALFMDDAIIYSPAAVVELLLFDEWEQASRGPKEAPEAVKAALDEWEACKQKERSITNLLRKDDQAAPGAGTHALESLEELEAWKDPGSPSEGVSEALAKLVAEHAVSAFQAVRGEGCHVAGVLKARSCLFQGAVRFKSAAIGDRVTLNGSWFRRLALGSLLGNAGLLTGNSQLSTFAGEAFTALRAAQETDPSNPDTSALDFRDSEIHGTIDLRKDLRDLGGTEDSSAQQDWRQGLIPPLVEVTLSKDPDPFKLLSIIDQSRNEIFKYWKYGEVTGANEPLRTLLESAKELYESSPSGAADMASLDEMREIWIRTDPERLERLVSIPRAGARLDLHIEEEALERFKDNALSNGRLASTIIAGEFDLSGTKVRGGVRARYAIMNISEGKQHKLAFRLINARIEGNLDLRNTVGFCNIDAKQVQVGGSARMAESPVLDRLLNRSAPLRERASLAFFVPSPGQADQGEDTQPFGCHRFEGARIGGDMACLFDHLNGPDLNLRSATIGGKLLILPAIGGVELTDEEYAQDRNADKENRKALAQPPFSVSARALASSLPGRIHRGLPFIPREARDNTSRIASPYQSWLSKANEQMPTEGGQARNTGIVRSRATPGAHPVIDLRAASTVTLAHPPSAWPTQDYLRIDGLEYKLTSQVGPLVPARRTWQDTISDRGKNMELPLVLTAHALFACGVALAFAMLVLAFQALDLAMSPGERLDWPTYLESLRHVGDLAWALVSGKALGGLNTFLIAATAALAWLLAILQEHTRPPPNAALVRAEHWLELQRRRLNTGRQYHMIYPFQPFIQAAEALRMAGRIRAANQVELARLRIRRRMLSKRRDAPLRIVLRLADSTMQYGYRPMGLVFILWCVVLSGSVVAKTSDLRGGVKPVPTVWNLVQEREDGDLAGLPAGPGPSPAAPEFNPLLYSIDASLPLLDLGQEKYWSVKTTGLPLKEETKPGSSGETQVVPDLPYILSQFFPWKRLASLANGAWNLWAAWYFSIARLAGWMLTAIVSVAIVARLEALVARNEA